MVINLKEYLAELYYTEGKSKNKKYRFQPVIKQYKRNTDKLKLQIVVKTYFCQLELWKLSGTKRVLNQSELMTSVSNLERPW
jgi:hypothetical protein